MEIINDPKLTRFLEGRVVRRYMANALRDYFKLGIAFPQLILNQDGSEIVGINTINAQHCRLTEARNGVIENCVVHGNWPDPPVSPAEIIPVLDSYDPLADLVFRIPCRLDRYREPGAIVPQKGLCQSDHLALACENTLCQCEQSIVLALRLKFTGKA